MPHLPLVHVDESWAPTSLSQGHALAFASVENVYVAYVYGRKRSGLYVSADAGARWRPTRARLPDDICITCMLSYADYLLAGTVGQGIFCRSKSGQRWWPAGKGLPEGDVVMALAAQEAMLLAGTRSCGIFRSDDGGRSWQPCSKGLPFEGHRLAILALATTTSGPVAAHPLGLHRLSLDASCWHSIAPPVPGPAVLLGLHVAEQGDLFGWSGSGVYRSGDAGTS